MYYKFLLLLNVFCTFAAIMRNVAYKICAVLLAVWYLMSIIGFGVHTCRGSQRSFLTTFVTGMTCEDIHPQHHCTCDHHSSEAGHDCCTDDFKVLSLTGVLPSAENDSGFFLHGDCVPFHDMYMESCHHLLSDSEFHLIKRMPDSGLIQPGDLQPVLGIWRI